MEEPHNYLNIFFGFCFAILGVLFLIAAFIWSLQLLERWFDDQKQWVRDVTLTAICIAILAGMFTGIYCGVNSCV